MRVVLLVVIGVIKAGSAYVAPIVICQVDGHPLTLGIVAKFTSFIYTP
jgi:hypothetical protein